MSRRVFADTWSYVALASPADGGHERAARFASSFRDRLVTSEFVLLETANFLRRVEARRSFTHPLRTIARDPRSSVIPASRSLFREGVALFTGDRTRSGR